MADLELSYTPAHELAARIRNGSLSPVTIVENALDRIKTVNEKLNCFCFVYPEESLALAKEMAAEAKAGKFRGPLHGIPFAIKDLTPTKGKRTTLGSFAYENWVPDYDAPIVEALKNAGGIMIGKTTTPEFAYSSFTESPLWGITRNPWNPERCAGGSSGGSGVAVATGCVPFAEGSDMGGSVRIPASFCGVLGLKPSFGRIPFTILPSQFDQISHFGPLARSVQDLCMFMQVTQGPDERDIQSLKPALDFLQPQPTDLKGKRFGLLLDFGKRVWHPDVEAAIRQGAEVLRQAGAEIEEISMSWSLEQDELWSKHWSVYLASFFGHVLPKYGKKMDPIVRTVIERGLKMSAVEFKQIEFGRTEMWKELSPILQKFDAVICPTMAQPAPTHGRSDQDFWRLDEQGRYIALDVTSCWNFVSQCPALSIPVGLTKDGLPIGLQVIGRRFDDLTPIGVAAVMEKRQPWAGQRPPI